MAQAFKRKRKPDSPSMSMSLEEHIAATERDPHPQYAKISDLDVISSGISFVTSRADLENYASTQNTHVVPNAYLANILNEEIVANNSRMTIHLNPLTQQNVLNNGEDGSNLPHVDDNGLSLYAARTHTHTLGELNAAAWNHNHDDVYSKLGHTHPYADVVHSHNEYVTYFELDSTGMYPNTVNVAANIDTSVEGESPIVSESHYDCNNFTSQGNYYLKPTGTDVIENGPGGETIGLLTVYVSTVEDSSYSDIIQFFYGEISWKRTCRIETTPTISTDPDTGEEFTSSEITTTFSEWVPLVETLPIGSLMFLNQDGAAPSGYIEANGAQVGSAAYPVLWKFARQRGLCILASNADYQAGKLDGYYGFIYNESISTKTISEEDIGCIIIGENDTVRELMDSNLESYVGRTLRYIPKEDIENIDFRLPNLGDNYYLQMCAYGNNTGIGFGVSTTAGLPNITGKITSIDETVVGGGNADIREPLTWADQFDVEGALSIKDSYRAQAYQYYSGEQSNLGYKTIAFDASESNSIYGNSNTVTPKNVSVRVFIKAYNGSIIKSDVAEADIRNIISDLLTQFGYATTTANGLVRLATIAQVDAGINDETVITPALLKHATSGYISSIKDSDGDVLPIDDRVVTLPSFAYRKGNITESLDAITVSCTAIVDISEPTNLYHDFVIPYETAYAVYVENGGSVTNMLDRAIADVVLKCNNASNAMGYPVGAVIPKPLCSYKSDSEAEYITHPTVTVFIDPTETYTEDDTFKKVKARLYWPLMWYFKRFTPAANDGSRSFPFVDADTGSDPTLAQIQTECAFWKVLINVHM